MQLCERTLKRESALSIALELSGLKNIATKPQSTSDYFLPSGYGISIDP